MHVSLPAILHLYWFPLDGFAPSMQEHIDAFARHSSWPVLSWNTALTFPKEVENFRFQAVLLHYSLFGGPIYWLGEQWLAFIKKQDALKTAIFQDEYRFWGIRYALLEELGIDLVFSCFDKSDFPVTYGKHGWNGRVEHTLTGYVGEQLRDRCRRLYKPREQRSRDVGYRARRLEEYMGRGAMEKHLIAERFLDCMHHAHCHLRLDCSANEEDRIYGEAWYAFIADCKAMLGVQAGVSIVDTNDILWPAWRRYKTENPQADWEQTATDLGLDAWEGGIPLRVISPRHFEAAAFGCVQILFEGGYSGVLQPMRHYIPLYKDFSNFDDVLRLLRDDAFCNAMADRTKKEVIDSGKWDYSRFVARFDFLLRECGMPPPGASALALRNVEYARTIFDQASQRKRDAVAAGAPWFGPHCFPRPHWPANLTNLAHTPWQDILLQSSHYSQET